MTSFLLAPPLVFVIYLLITYLMSKSAVLFSAKGKDSPGKEKAYACGENVKDHRVQPNYSEFFPFAFFFTIMHVVALIIATIPTGVSVLPVIYIVIAVLAIYILFRRRDYGA